MSASIRGRGYLSFGHLKFKLVKSTHILHISPNLCTITMFDTHCGYWTSLMKLASRSLVTSLKSSMSERLAFLIYYLTCQMSLWILRRWQVISFSMSSISIVVQVNTSKLFKRFWMSLLLCLGYITKLAFKTHSWSCIVKTSSISLKTLVPICVTSNCKTLYSLSDSLIALK